MEPFQESQQSHLLGLQLSTTRSLQISTPSRYQNYPFSINGDSVLYACLAFTYPFVVLSLILCY